MSETINVRMYDGKIVRVPKGTRKADVIRRYYMNKYAPLVAEMENKHGIPASLFMRLLDRESAFNPRARSKAGAVGIAQLMPIHRKKVNPLDPKASITYATKYLGDHFKRFGSWEKALAAYNWGQGNLSEAINKYGDEWIKYAPKETREYVEALGRYIEPKVSSGPVNPRTRGTNSKTSNQTDDSTRSDL